MRRAPPFEIASAHGGLDRARWGAPGGNTALEAREAALRLGLVAAALVSVLALAAGAGAAPPSEGDWNVTGSEAYADQAITLAWASDNSSLGNLTVAPSASLQLDNVTLFLPVLSAFDIEGSVVVRNSTLVGAGYRIIVNGTATFEDNTIMNATFGGTVIESDAATFLRNTWDCGGSSSGTIHIRRPVDFTHNTMRQACLVSFELAPLATAHTIEFAWNTFNDTGSGTQITFQDALHTGRVIFDMHDLLVDGGGWSVLIGATAPNTSHWIHDSVFINNGLATVRADDYEGDLHLWNLSYHNIYRAARINGVPGSGVVARIDNITVTGNTTDSIYANEATWIIRNSTIAGTTTQFEGDTNGHIKIYDTDDTAFDSAVSGSGGTVEHFALLNVVSLRWQGDVPMTGNLVKFRNATGRNFLNITPWNWSPSYIVWWGMYGGNSRVDNQDLRPSVEQGPYTFACAPSQFFVSVPMAPLSIVCTDDEAPTVAVDTPSFPLYTNGDTVTINGRFDEPGSGLLQARVYLGQWYDLSPPAGATGITLNLTFPLDADGGYAFIMAATDRVGHTVNVTFGPIVRDTVVPWITVENDTLPINQSTFALGGSTEPNTTLHVRFSGGWNRTVALGPDGRFSFSVPVSEGQNTYLVISTDRAGNSLREDHVVVVDRTAPVLSFIVDGQPDLDLFTTLGTALVTGWCEGQAWAAGANSSTTVGSQFELEVPLNEGANHVQVTCTDAAGNVASASADVFFDNTPPILTLAIEGASPLPDGSYLLTSNVAPLIANVEDAGSGAATVAINGFPHELLTGGTVSASVTLQDGENQVHVLAVDRAGNFAQETLHILRDTTAPVLTASWQSAGEPILEEVGGSVTAGASAHLVVVLSEAASVEAAGAAHDLPAGTSTLEVSLSEGQNVVSIDYEDAAGNTGVPVVMVITRDSVPPAVTVDSPAPGAELDTPEVTVDGQAEPGAAVLVQGARVSVGANGQFHATVALAEGRNTVTVEARDALGNAANTSVTVTYTPPAEPPAEAPAGGLELPMLVLGLAVGAGVGAAAMAARRRASPARRPGDGGPSGPPAAEPEGRAPPGPHQGPRGPQPPP